METIAQQKQELVLMIEAVNNPELLCALKNLLSESEKDLILKERMTHGALKSEEDYKAGRIYTREQVVEKTNLRFNK